MDRVTITGADDWTPIPALVDLSEQLDLTKVRSVLETCKDLITREA